jgi:DNA polymerase III subunit gamma/tau
MAAKLTVPSLTRAWSMLLKGLFEVRDAARPVQACEMALIRLAYAADLPPTDKLVRDLLDNPARNSLSPQGGEGKGEGVVPRASIPAGQSALSQRESASLAPAPRAEAAPAASLRSLEDLAAFAQAKGAPLLKVHIENDIHLVSIEPGRLEFRPSQRAPRTLAADLAQRLKDWTGTRWVVTLAREGGAPTLAEQKKAAKTARHERVLQEPLVRAVLDRFPGAEIVAVRDVLPEDAAAPMPEGDEE